MLTRKAWYQMSPGTNTINLVRTGPPGPIIIGYCINTAFYDRGHVLDAFPSLRGNALPRHERGHKMLYLYHNRIIIYPYKINWNPADT